MDPDFRLPLSEARMVAEKRAYEHARHKGWLVEVFVQDDLPAT
jgi:hypothetical protein